MALSDKIALKIASELNLDQEKSDVIAYGAFAFIQIVLSLLFVIIFGFIFEILFEAITISFVSSILRKYSGGVHASKPSICIIVGTVMTIGIALLMCFISSYSNELANIIIGFVSFIWSYYIILKYAPVDSKAKPINTILKRKRLKKKSLIVLLVYFIIAILLIYTFYLTNNRVFLTYSMCIYGGLVWQVFNLTIIGHKVLNKFDALLVVILFKKKGVLLK